MNDIKPIETSYSGYKFRSRLEARWAVLFDQLDIKWQYEAEGYETPFGRYVPDFWLPDVHMRQTDLKGVLFEVKPESYTDRLHNALAYVGEMNKCGAILSVGWPSELMGQDENLFEIAPGWDNCMGLAKCSNGHVRFYFLPVPIRRMRYIRVQEILRSRHGCRCPRFRNTLSVLVTMIISQITRTRATTLTRIRRLPAGMNWYVMRGVQFYPAYGDWTWAVAGDDGLVVVIGSRRAARLRLRGVVSGGR